MPRTSYDFRAFQKCVRVWQMPIFRAKTTSKPYKDWDWTLTLDWGSQTQNNPVTLVLKGIGLLIFGKECNNVAMPETSKSLLRLNLLVAFSHEEPWKLKPVDLVIKGYRLFFAKIECNSVAMGRVSKVVRRFQLYICVRHEEPNSNNSWNLEK